MDFLKRGTGEKTKREIKKDFHTSMEGNTELETNDWT